MHAQRTTRTTQPANEIVMSKRARTWIAGLGALTVLLLVVALNSAWRPAEMIERSLLRLTPIGSSIEDVQRAVENKGWQHRPISNAGFLKQESHRAMEVVGKKSLEAHVADYGWPFRTSVDAFWGFDEKGRLTDVWVWKTVDAP